jgi:hypothetical protein
VNFISIGFWAAFCAFFLIYIFVRRWNRTAMLLWVLAFDLFFFWQANGWLMLLLPATAAVNYFLTELLRRSGAPQRADRNYFSDKFAEKPISAPPSTTPPHATGSSEQSDAGGPGGTPHGH